MSGLVGAYFCLSTLPGIPSVSLIVANGIKVGFLSLFEVIQTGHSSFPLN